MKKGRDLTQSYDKKLLHRQKNKKQRDIEIEHKNATKNFDNTTIAERLRTVSWGNDNQPTRVVKPVYGITYFPLDD